MEASDRHASALWAAEQPGNLDDAITLASAQVGLGRVLAANPVTLDQAAQAFTKGIELRQAITRKYPERVDQTYRLALELSERCWILSGSPVSLSRRSRVATRPLSASSSSTGDFPTRFPTRRDFILPMTA